MNVSKEIIMTYLTILFWHWSGERERRNTEKLCQDSQ
jgi:hypothetical protein